MKPEPKKPRLVLAEGTQPYGHELPEDERPTKRQKPVVVGADARARAPESAGRYSHVYGRTRDAR